MRRRGCISGLGFIFVLVFLFLLGVATLLQGGLLLASPGPLSAVAPRATPLGGYSSHAEFENECGRCHAPIWSGERMADRCVECHTNVGDELAARTGLHGRLPNPRQCKRCHTEHKGRTARLTRFDVKDFPHEVDTVGFTLKEHRKDFDKSPLQCKDCHTVSISTFEQQVCTDCHRRGQPTFTDQHIVDVGEDCLACHDGSGKAGRFDHDTMTNFPLEGEHREVKCKKCHREKNVFSGLDTTCYSCHQKDDKHKGKYGTSCESCHTPKDWERSTFRHDLSTFMFEGRLLDISINCYVCHQADDKHDGRFGTQCQACHNTRSWEEGVFDHNKTDFPLTGKHRDIECEACHIGKKFTGLDAACVSCHLKDDAHDGRFGTQCDVCHNTQTWEEASFDHDRTNFPLTGKHVNVDCEACHIGGQYTGLDTACVSCHLKDDAHNGQFGTQCEQCHVPDAWDRVTFDHNQTNFPLDGAHVNVPCKSCHVGGQYAGTPTECVACHPEPDVHKGQFGTACAECHTTTAWKPAYLPEHTFPLDHGSRTILACDVCHDQGTFETYTCYNCHEHTPDKIRREHLEEGITDFQDCVRCHPTGREEEGEFGEGED